ncbi:hypothetical protein ACQZ6F_19200 [Rhizobium sp. A22-96]
MPADHNSHPLGPVSGSSQAKVEVRSINVAAVNATREDAAIVIGMALAFAHRGQMTGNAIPLAVLSRLGMLADRGDPASELVCDWLRTRTQRAVRPAAPTDAGEMISVLKVAEGN